MPVSVFVDTQAGVVRVVTGTFAQLPSPAAAGMLAVSTDANSSTWGDPVTASGIDGTTLVFYNGTNWTVVGI